MMNSPIWKNVNTRAEVIILLMFIRGKTKISMEEASLLEEHYSITPRTMGDALRSLKKTGLLEKDGKTDFLGTDLLKKFIATERKLKLI